MNWKHISPSHVVQPVFGNENDALSIELTDAASVGHWESSVPVEAGRTYRFTAVADVPAKSFNNVTMLVTWCPAENDSKMIQRDYIGFQDKKGLRCFDETFQAPEGSTFAILWCVHKWQKGKAVFRDIRMEEVAEIPPRRVRLATVNIYPKTERTFAANLAIMEDALKNVCEKEPNLDLIVTPECHTDRMVNLPIVERSEPIPGGMTFELCKRYAVQYHVNILANIHELTPEGHVHNTAFVVDRQGKLAGLYRKVHLTVSEQMMGVIAGEEFNVIDLDFGRLGIAVCWDNWFSESARALRLNGAELLAFPLAGDGKESHWSKTWSTRCIDNGIPMVVCVGDPKCPSAIVDRDGEWLSSTMEQGGYAFAEIDLNERKRSWWLSVGPADGDPYQLYLAERRQIAYPQK